MGTKKVIVEISPALDRALVKYQKALRNAGYKHKGKHRIISEWMQSDIAKIKAAAKAVQPKNENHEQ